MTDQFVHEYAQMNAPLCPLQKGAFYLSKRGVKDGTKSSHS